jgi:flagellar hook protein FlgE
MSVFSSLYVDRTGMQVYERNMQNIGDNIANINTIGYKSSRGIFADIFYNSLLSGTSQVGIGSQLLSVQRVTTQGVLLGTNISTDLGVKGAGFFTVVGEGPAGKDQYYTRAGQMELDHSGFLVNPQGMRVQGYAANGKGNILPTLGDLEIGNRESPPTVSTEIGLNLNLGATEAIGAGFDTLDPAGTSQFSTSVSVFDSLGDEHQIDVYFEKTAANEWSWHATVDDGELENGTEGVLTEIATGTLSFTKEGTLDAQVQVGGTMNFQDAEPQTITFDFGEDLASGGDGAGSTQHAGLSAIEEAHQNGFAAGRLQFIVVEPDGKVVGTFSNGNVHAIGQIATALFLSPGNLEGMGDNLFRESIESGAPAIGAPNSGGRGQVFSGALEQSNVDLTNEFTQMIITQRAFQASSRTITTSDEMLAEVVNLKR